MQICQKPPITDRWNDYGVKLIQVVFEHAQRLRVSDILALAKKDACVGGLMA